MSSENCEICAKKPKPGKYLNCPGESQHKFCYPCWDAMAYKRFFISADVFCPVGQNCLNSHGEEMPWRCKVSEWRGARIVAQVQLDYLEAEKLQKLKDKKRKKEEKNVGTVVQSENIPGHQNEDLETVLQKFAEDAVKTDSKQKNMKKSFKEKKLKGVEGVKEALHTLETEKQQLSEVERCLEAVSIDLDKHVEHVLEKEGRIETRGNVVQKTLTVCPSRTDGSNLGKAIKIQEDGTFLGLVSKIENPHDMVDGAVSIKTEKANDKEQEDSGYKKAVRVSSVRPPFLQYRKRSEIGSDSYKRNNEYTASEKAQQKEVMKEGSEVNKTQEETNKLLKKGQEETDWTTGARPKVQSTTRKHIRHEEKTPFPPDRPSQLLHGKRNKLKIEFDTVKTTTPCENHVIEQLTREAIKTFEFLSRSQAQLCHYCQVLWCQNCIMKCGDCRKAMYCDEVCQAADWENHRPLCLVYGGE